MQAARNLFLAHGEKLTNAKALVRDRGSQFTRSFDENFRTQGMKVLKSSIDSCPTTWTTTTPIGPTGHSSNRRRHRYEPRT